MRPRLLWLSLSHACWCCQWSRDVGGVENKICGSLLAVHVDCVNVLPAATWKNGVTCKWDGESKSKLTLVTYAVSAGNSTVTLSMLAVAVSSNKAD